MIVANGNVRFWQPAVRWSVTGGLILLAVIIPARVQAICCICRGWTQDTCSPQASVRTCADCAATCNELIACCDTADCSGGVTERCGAGRNVCLQLVSSDFCAGTCLNGTPTSTPSDTPTVTPTDTPADTPTDTPAANATPTATSPVTASDTPVSAGGSCTSASQCARALSCVDGVCLAATTPAPTMFANGLMVGVGILLGVGILILLRLAVL